MKPWIRIQINSGQREGTRARQRRENSTPELTAVLATASPCRPVLSDLNLSVRGDSLPAVTRCYRHPNGMQPCRENEPRQTTHACSSGTGLSGPLGTSQINSLGYIRSESVPGGGSSAARLLRSGESFLRPTIATAVLRQDAENMLEKTEKSYYAVRISPPLPSHPHPSVTFSRSRLQAGSQDVWSLVLFPVWLKTSSQSGKAPKRKKNTNI